MSDPRYALSFWGPPTHGVKSFCEEDYQITYYIAEFINTLSNVAYVILAYHGYRQRGPKSLLPFLALAFVGIASVLYHASLKFLAGLGDEFSMLGGAAIVIHRLCTIGWSDEASLRLTAVLISLLGFVEAVRFDAIHVPLKANIVHDGAFACMIVAVCFLTVYRIARAPVSDDVRRGLRTKARVGAATFISGYGIWLIDVYYCDTLRAWRRQIGWPLAFGLELHGWWHVLTAIGVYCYIDLVVELRSQSREAKTAVKQDKTK